MDSSQATKAREKSGPKSAIVAVAPDQVHPVDFAAANQAADQQMRALSSLLESFSRKLSANLTSYIGVDVEISLKTVSQITSEEFLAKLSPASYLMELLFQPTYGKAVLHVDDDALFPILDALLGGTGAPASVAREVTELEDLIMTEVVRAFCSDLQNAWATLAIGVEAGKRQSLISLTQLQQPSDRVLMIQLNAKIAESLGSLYMMVPASGCTALLRRPSSQEGSSAATTAPNHHVRQQLLDCDFEVELGLTKAKVSAQELLGLREGSVLRLDLPIRTPSSLLVGGVDAFQALPVRSGGKRAAQLGNRKLENEESKKQ